MGEGKEEGICGKNDVSGDLVDTHGTECQHWVSWSETVLFNWKRSNIGNAGL